MHSRTLALNTELHRVHWISEYRQCTLNNNSVNCTMTVYTAQWQCTLYNDSVHCTMKVYTIQWRCTLYNNSVHCTITVHTTQWQCTLHNDSVHNVENSVHFKMSLHTGHLGIVHCQVMTDITKGSSAISNMKRAHLRVKFPITSALHGLNG